MKHETYYATMAQLIPVVVLAAGLQMRVLSQIVDALEDSNGRTLFSRYMLWSLRVQGVLMILLLVYIGLCLTALRTESAFPQRFDVVAIWTVGAIVGLMSTSILTVLMPRSPAKRSDPGPPEEDGEPGSVAG